MVKIKKTNKNKGFIPLNLRVLRALRGSNFFIHHDLCALRGETSTSRFVGLQKKLIK